MVLKNKSLEQIDATCAGGLSLPFWLLALIGLVPTVGLNLEPYSQFPIVSYYSSQNEADVWLYGFPIPFGSRNSYNHNGRLKPLEIGSVFSLDTLSWTSLLADFGIAAFLAGLFAYQLNRTANSPRRFTLAGLFATVGFSGSVFGWNLLGADRTSPFVMPSIVHLYSLAFLVLLFFSWLAFMTLVVMVCKPVIGEETGGRNGETGTGPVCSLPQPPTPNHE